GRRERLDRAERTHRPGLTDPLPERQERTRQPARLGQPPGKQPYERGGAAQPGPADRIADLREAARGAAERAVGRGEGPPRRGYPPQAREPPPPAPAGRRSPGPPGTPP